MAIKISAIAETFPIAGKFTISRGAKTHAHVVTVTISDGSVVGRGECVPYGRYGETVESVIYEIQSRAKEITANPNREGLRTLMVPGAARNAIDCALWDFEAKAGGDECRKAAWSRQGCVTDHRLHALAWHARGNGGLGTRGISPAAAEDQGRRHRRH